MIMIIIKFMFNRYAAGCIRLPYGQRLSLAMFLALHFFLHFESLWIFFVFIISEHIGGKVSSDSFSEIANRIQSLYNLRKRLI